MLRCFGQGVSVPSSSGPIGSGHALPQGQNGTKGCGTLACGGPNGNKGGYNGYGSPVAQLNQQNFESDIQVNGIAYNFRDILHGSVKQRLLHISWTIC